MKRLLALAVLCVVVCITVSGCQTVTTDIPKLQIGKEYEIYLDSDFYNPGLGRKDNYLQGIVESQSKEWLYVKSWGGHGNYHINLNRVTCIFEILDK